MSAVIPITSREQLDAILTADPERLVVIYFLTAWCAPCKYMLPFYERLASDNPRVVFLSLDCDQHRLIANSFGVNTYPTISFYKHGALVASVVGEGVAERQAIARLVANFCSSK